MKLGGSQSQAPEARHELSQTGRSGKAVKRGTSDVGATPEDLTFTHAALGSFYPVLFRVRRSHFSAGAFRQDFRGARRMRMGNPLDVALSPTREQRRRRDMS